MIKALIGFLLCIYYAQSKSVESVLNVIIESGNPSLLLLPVNALGLANRLRIMASAYSIALSTAATLVVIWGKSVDCNSSFDELFDVAVSSHLYVHSMSQQDSTLGVFDALIRTAVRNVAHKKHIGAKEHYIRDFLVDTNMMSTAINIIWTRGTHAPQLKDCGEYLHSKKQFYQHLMPSSTVSQLINSVGEELGRSGGGTIVAGVHIRAFDTTFDWPVVSPSLAAIDTTDKFKGRLHNYGDQDKDALLSLQSKRFDEAASLDVFVNLMSDLIKSNPSIRFFLASNSVQAKQLIVAHFGSERVITLVSPDIGQRDTAKGIAVAAAEFLLLGEAAFVVHTRGSSFAREAASRRTIPVIDVTLEYQQNTMQTAPPQLLPVYFYSQRESLPHCAMPEYIRSPARVHVLRGSEELEENSRACGVVLSENAIAGSMSSPGSQDADTVVGTGENSVPVVPAVVGTCAPSNAEDERRPPPHKVCYTEDDRVVCSVAYTVCPCAVLHQRQEYLLGMLLEKVMCNVPQEGDGILPNERCVSLLAESNGYSL